MKPLWTPRATHRIRNPVRQFLWFRGTEKIKDTILCLWAESVYTRPTVSAVGLFNMIMESMRLTGDHDPSIACRGMCSRCGEEHALPVGPARGPALELFRRMEREGRIDFGASEPDPRYSTEYLYGPARGQMFGVLVARDRAGDMVSVKAFSGQYNSVWRLDGWADPLLDADRFRRDTFDGGKAHQGAWP